MCIAIYTRSVLCQQQRTFLHKRDSRPQHLVSEVLDKSNLQLGMAGRMDAHEEEPRGFASARSEAIGSE